MSKLEIKVTLEEYKKDVARYVALAKDTLVVVEDDGKVILRLSSFSNRILDENDLKDEEYRKQILEELREHYGEPVKPVSQYCSALETWAKIKMKDDPNYIFGPIYTDIHKSCLLDRLIYQNGKLRTVECPKHKGHWSGMWFNSPCECVAPCGCITGWLPNPDEKPPTFAKTVQNDDGTVSTVLQTMQEAYDDMHKKKE